MGVEFRNLRFCTCGRALPDVERAAFFAQIVDVSVFAENRVSVFAAEVTEFIKLFNICIVFPDVAGIA